MNESTDNGVQPEQVDDIQSNAYLSTETEAPAEATETDANETPPEGDKPDGDGSEKKVRNRPGREERESFRLQQEVQQLREQLAKQSNGANPQNPTEDTGPKLEDFDDALEYAEARAEWKIEQKLKARDEAVTQAAQQKQLQELVAHHEEREEAYMETVPDYEEKVTNLLQSGYVTPDIQVAVLQSDMSPQIAYHFANHEGGMNDLAILHSLQGNPQALNAAIKQIEAFIKGTPAQAAVKKTSAPPPISPPKGQASQPKALDEMDYDEYVKARESQTRR